MELVSTFSERLKEALDGIVITEFASNINISKQSISAYIHEKRKPKIQIINFLANELNVNDMWLQGYNVPKKRDPKQMQYTYQEKTIIAYYRSFDSHGKSKLLAYLEDIRSSGKYNKAMDNQEFSGNNGANVDDEEGDDRPIIIPGADITEEMLEYI